LSVSASSERVIAALRESLKETDRLRRQNRRLLAAAREPLAIVGMSCRFPGGAASPHAFWRLLEAGTDAISRFPADRGWDLPTLYEPDPEAAHTGRSYVRDGGFLDDAAEFDAEFFKISPREALVTDPQQRLLLEAAWEALEDAGLDPSSLQGSSTGVFAGAMYQDYGLGLQSYGGARQSGQARQQPNVLVGSTNSVITGRVAYALGLEGPAVTVDTACSSSLVALHLACQSLRTGECSLALAGGVTVLSTPGVFVEFSRQRGLAPDGRCKAFADSADGTSVSEGVGLLALERLSDARRNDHPVLAVVRGSAINQDGASNGLTAPNGLAQRQVIRQALASAGLEAGAIDAVEAHGTGTMLGDPIEARALIATYGRDRPRGHPLWLGSVKSNVGHTQAAAGVAGVIKMVLAMRNGLLPQTLHVDRPSSKVEWDGGEVSLLTEALAWPRGQEPRRAAISSFGISGTNAHLILEEAPSERFAPSPAFAGSRRGNGNGIDGGDPAAEQASPAEGIATENPDDPDAESIENGAARPQAVEVPLDLDVFPWVLSGRGSDGLQRQAERLEDFVNAEPELLAANIGASLARRPVFESRGVVVGADGDELLAGVRALAGGASRPGVVRGAVPTGGVGGVVYVFPGQGSQWSGMALELMHRSTVFARRIRECDEALAPFLDWSLEGLLSGADGAPELERVDVVQPALFAVMVALAEVWQACGVRADAVVGHSQGEIAAACVAGGLSLQDAARLIALRSRALRALAGRGGMVSIAAGAADVRMRLEPFCDRISVAAVNGPGAVVVSGEIQALDELLAGCKADGVRARAIPVDYAAHSAQVEEIREALLDGCAGIAPRSSTVPFYSSVSGGLLDTAALDADYWYRNLRDTVEFDRATRALLDGGLRMFIEISPHPVVTVGAQETVDALVGEEVGHVSEGVEGAGSTDLGVSGAVDPHAANAVGTSLPGSEPPEAHDLENVTILGSLRKGDGGPRRLLSSLSEAWAHGAPVDWKAVLAESDAHGIKLPTYAFGRRRYWLESPVEGGVGVVAAGQAPADHPLLGAAIASAEGNGLLFTGRLALSSHPWLVDHAVMGAVLMPASALLDLALHAGSQIGCDLVQELRLQTPLVIEESEGVQLQLIVGEPDAQGARPVSIYSRPQPADSELPQTGDAWTCHANGSLAPEGAGGGNSPSDGRMARLSGSWPPPGAERLDLDELYAWLSQAGFECGPAFRSLRGAWRLAECLLFETVLPEEQWDTTEGFSLHPALLETVLHGIDAAGIDGHATADSHRMRVPLSWSDVEVYAAGGRSLRACIAPAGSDAFSLALADDNGTPLAQVGRVSLGQLRPEQLSGLRRRASSLLQLDWVSAAMPAQSAQSESATWATVGECADKLAAVLRAPLSSASSSGEESPVGGEALEKADQALDEEDPSADGASVYSDLGELGQAIDDGVASPALVLVACGLDWSADTGSGRLSEADAAQADDLPRLAHRTVHAALELAQAWIADERLSDARLVVLTVAAVSAREGEDVRGLAAAPVWGLLRSAQSEHPDRMVLVDVDGDARSWNALPAALASGEPQLAIRDGLVLVPRLARADSGGSPVTPVVAGPEESVLITGGTGQLGGLLAKHLVSEHGVRNVVLVSRRGGDAPDAAALEGELMELGAHVRVVACDVADREQLARLIASIPEEHPLGAVVHAAGVLDDGVLDVLTPQRMDHVLTPKLDAAWRLHELTKHLKLRSFVLFSSVAGTLGGPGQGNYAAANTFLDALAAYRQSQGLPAVSMAWGWWEQASAMTGHLRDVDLARLRRAGFEAFSSAEGLGLFDAAMSSGKALSVPLRLDETALALAAHGAPLPPLLRGLVKTSRRAQPTNASGSLARRLAGLSPTERARIALEVVRGEVATVLGHDSSTAIDARRAFKDLGFDSLLAVELRNRINDLAGLRLPATLVFDHPNPAALTTRLLSELDGAKTQAPALAIRPVRHEEPIAIVGMGCRYPGGASSPEGLWTLLASDTDAISPFPTDREWDLERLDNNGLGASYMREGGFVYDVAEFDPEFFGISPREAITMDPQQRLLLETSWETFEDAGIIPASGDGVQTGVFVGVNSQDYGIRFFGAGGAGAEGYLITGNSASFLSGRLAYVLGLQGPAISIDTACSSSLVALHLACGALRGGECSLALAGGASVMSTPVGFTEFSRQGGLAHDGRCKSFADAADGTNWGEGVGMVLLERLSDARRLGHEVLAVVRSSAVNQDGASNGLTAPNGPSQERVIRQALANAALSPHEVDAVEAHGTGTRLGDPIEAQALIETYGKSRPAERPLWLGSIKSNIGHTQAAGGIAGVIKMVMALRHQCLPRTLHVDSPTNQVDWSSGTVSLLTEARPWERAGESRRAGISSFGISGTNVHLILEEAPIPDGFGGAQVSEGLGGAPVSDGFGEAPVPDGSGGAPVPEGFEGAQAPEGLEGSPVLEGLGGAPAPGGQRDDRDVASLPVLAWTLSGKGREALRAQAVRLRDLVEAKEHLDAADIGVSLAGRSAFEDRAVVLGAGRSELLEGLAALAVGKAAPNLVEGLDQHAGATAFMFTGQGAQRVGMGAELYSTLPVFKAALDEVCGQLEEYLEHSLLALLFADPDSPSAIQLDQTMFTQAGLFALEVSLVRLLDGWGVKPDYLIGHSIGELAAAHVAGVFSLRDACRLVAARGRLMGELAVGGAMIAVQASEQEALESLVGLEDQVALAAVNGRRSVVLSGEDDAVLACGQIWSERGRKVKRLRVSHAFHSPRMDGMLEAFAEVAHDLSYAHPQIPVVSNASGESVSEELCSPEYWVKHVRDTVRFADGIGWLSAQGVSSFLEIGPSGVLSAMIPDCPQAEDRKDSATGRWAVPVLSAGRPEALSLIGALAELWTRGGTVDWQAMLAGAGARRVSLPTYPFRRQRYWMESGVTAQASERSLTGEAESSFLDAAEHEDLDALLRILEIDGEQQRSSLGALLPSLAAWRRHSRERSTVDSWRYQVDWKPIAIEASAGSARWLAILPAHCTADPWLVALMEELERRGVEVLRVVGETEGDMRKDLAGSLRGALDGLPDGGRVDRVLSLLALDEQRDPIHPSVPRGLAGTVALVQALSDADVRAPFWMVTRNAVSIGSIDRMVSPLQAQTWGLGLTVGLELAQQKCGVVDLPQDLDERVGALLVDSLMGEGEEDQLAVRPAGVFARRLAHIGDGEQLADRTWTPSAGTILITGGTGGLGAHVARWLARTGAERLLLVSRRGAEAPGAEALRDELSELGVEVQLAACDVAERDQLAELIGSLPEEAQLSAVVHAAGVGFYGPVGSMGSEDLARALGAKAQGALNLDALTEHMDLSAFVLFSSIASTLGSGQQGAYAAANACLDALASQRHARGLPATSVAWGPWAGEGMVGAADGEAAEALRRRGLECMAPELTIKALERALLEDRPAVAVADIRWDVYAPIFALARARPMIEELPEVRSLSRTDGGPRDEGAADELRRSLAAAPAAERSQVLLGFVRTEVARVLGHASSDAIDANRAFKDLGFDSLLAVELRNRLCAVMGLDLPATLVFDYPTPAAVADYLLGELGVEEDEASPLRELERLEHRLGSLVDQDQITAARSRLLALLARLDGSHEQADAEQQDEQAVAGLIESASDEEIFGFIDRELG
jgi:acyl transferase domain-containing protein/acyl carrier protein